MPPFQRLLAGGEALLVAILAREQRIEAEGARGIMADGSGMAEQARLVLGGARLDKGGLIIHRLPVLHEIDQQADRAVGVGKAQQLYRTREQATRRDGGDELAKALIVPGIVGMAPHVERGHLVQPGGDVIQRADRDVGQRPAMILHRAANLAARIAAEQREIVATGGAHGVKIDLIDGRGIDPQFPPGRQAQQRRIRGDPAQPQHTPITAPGDGVDRRRVLPARGEQAIIFDIGPVDRRIARLVEAERRHRPQQARAHRMADQRQRDILASTVGDGEQFGPRAIAVEPGAHPGPAQEEGRIAARLQRLPAGGQRRPVGRQGECRGEPHRAPLVTEQRRESSACAVARACSPAQPPDPISSCRVVGRGSGLEPASSIGLSASNATLRIDRAVGADAGTDQIAAHMTGQEALKHHEIGAQRPEWIAEGGRAIALDQHMADPGEAIAGDRQGCGQPPSTRNGRSGRDADHQAGPGIMHGARRGPGMFLQIIGPEVPEPGDLGHKGHPLCYAPSFIRGRSTC